MIIRTTFRRAGQLAAHLGRTDTNESVETLDALCRDCPADDTQALRLFTAISRSNSRTRRDLVHMKMSPSTVELSIEQIGVALARYEAAHGIPNTMPRKVKRHRRGDRPRHLHVVYPVVDPATGRAVRSQNNFLADEVASRCLEVEFGEPIIPGPRQEQVVAVLRAKGEHDLARALDGYESAAVGDRIGDAGYRQAATLGADLGRIRREIDVAWTAAGGDRDGFARSLQVAGLALCQGDNAILVVDEASGSYVPLARTLRQRAKQLGRPERVRERDLQLLLGTRPPFDHARSEGLRREEERAARAADDEMDRMAAEADLDDQHDLAERLRRAAADRRTRKREAFRKSLAERRRAIAAEYARRDRVRRARVVRAARVAGMLGTRDLRRIGMLVAGSVVLAGGGLGLALVAAGLAVAILPTRERVRALALKSRLEKAQDRDGRERAMAAAFQAVEIEFGADRTRSLRFSDIPKSQRVLAGAYANLTLASTERPLDPKLDMVHQAAARVLGPAAPGIEALIFGRGGRAGLTVCGWHNPQTPRLQKALEAAFLAAGEGDAAAVVRERGTRKPGRGKKRASGREL